MHLNLARNTRVRAVLFSILFIIGFSTAFPIIPASILLWAIASVNRYLSLAFPRKHTESNTSTSGVTHHRCFHTVAASLIHG